MRISPEYVATLQYMLKAAESQLAAFKSGEKYVRMEEEFRKQLREKDTIIKYFQHTGHIQPAFSLFLTLLFTFSSFKKQSFCYFPSMLIAFLIFPMHPVYLLILSLNVRFPLLRHFHNYHVHG